MKCIEKSCPNECANCGRSMATPGECAACKRSIERARKQRVHDRITEMLIEDGYIPTMGATT